MTTVMPGQTVHESGHSGVSLARWVAAGQALLYLATGLWPVIHLRSFLSVTGPKTDLWLVESFGLLIAAFGLVLHRYVLRLPWRDLARVPARRGCRGRDRGGVVGGAACSKEAAVRRPLAARSSGTIG